MSDEVYADRILRAVQARDYRPQEADALARAMRIGKGEQGDFHAACKALMKTGRIVLGASNALMLPEPPGKVIGVYRGNERGFGFVVPDTANSHGDIFVPPGKSGDAVTGDRVAARVVKRGKRGGKMLYEGRVIDVLERGCSRIVGELLKQGRRWLVMPDGNILHVPIVVGDPGAKNARVGDQVVVEITQYPAEGKEARGVVLRVLGPRGEPRVDTLSIIEQYHLPEAFGKEVLSEAKKVTRDFDAGSASGEREDLRKLTILTIDPSDARDFDDAISLTVKRNGEMELGVHIADVAHFVQEGSALDREARSRSNSIYLPGTVIPMIPEVLSNGVCSLQERQARFTKSAFITYDRRGKVKGSRLANTVIKSMKRLTYEQAGKILDGTPGRTGAKVVALLKNMQKLAKVIRQRRLSEGMLELDLPEVELVHDDDGKVIDVTPADAHFSHKIIEMFMVEANEAVARTLAKGKVAALRRIHPEPRDLAGGGLRRFLAVLGHDLAEDADRFALQSLLDEVRGTSEAFAVHLAVLRSMQQAEYAPILAGHYALASEHYCHFTSPIRRYADLTIHRLVDSYLGGAFKKKRRKKPAEESEREEALVELGELCSTNERRAEAAERELRLVLVLRLLEEKHVGEVLDGIVTGVANVGVFVQLERFLIDGLLRFDNLADDWWEVAPSRGCVVGERTGHKITVGDRLAVKISRIQLSTRQMELSLATPLKGAKGASSRQGKKPSGRARSGRAPRAKKGTKSPPHRGGKKRSRRR